MLLTPSLAEDKLDSVKVDPIHHRVLFENDQVRVVRWYVAARDTTLFHSHPDNLNICLTDYDGRVSAPKDKVAEVRAKAGSVSWRQAGCHAVENLSGHAMEGIIVEPKQPRSTRPAGSPDPVAADPEHHKVEFENDQIRVLRERREPGDLPLHGHPDCVQIPLTDLNAILVSDGRSETVTRKAGDVRWRLATAHQGTVLGEEPMEQIVVEMKSR